LKEILGFLQLFTHYIRETKNKGKLKLDLPFEAIPSAIILLNNVIPNPRTSIFVSIFVHDLPPDIIRLFERTFIFINFRENCRRVDFREFAELLPYMFKKFNVLIFEERTLIMFFKSRKTNLSIMKLLSWE
jgi:hypothetical protein